MSFWTCIDAANVHKSQPINCVAYLAALNLNPLPDFIDQMRLRTIQVALTGETGIYTYASGLIAESFGPGINITGPSIANKTSYNRTGRYVAEFDFIQRLIATNFFKGKRVLDFPTGRGNLVLDLRKKEINAYGSDLFISKSLLKEGHFFPGDLSNSSFQAGAFGIVLSLHGPYSIFLKMNPTEQNKLLVEMNRILSSDGKFVFGPFSPDETATVKGIIAKYSIWAEVEEVDYQYGQLPQKIVIISKEPK